MGNYYAPCFYRIDFVAIPSYIELPWVEQHLEAGRLLSENHALRSSTLSSKNNSKNCAKARVSSLIELYDGLWWKWDWKSNENENKIRIGYKHTKYKICQSTMMVILKQHLSNTWSSIHEKVKQHWGWVEKRRCFPCLYKCMDSAIDTLSQCTDTQSYFYVFKSLNSGSPL